MATWKKVIVSGSDAHLASITSSVLTDNNLLVAGTGGAIENSGITYDGSNVGLGSSTITSTGATSVKAAIESDPTLGGAAMSVRVVSATDYGEYEVTQGTSFLGVTFNVEVIA